MKKELKGKQKIIYTLIHLLMLFTLAQVLGKVLLINLNSFSVLILSFLAGTVIQLFVLLPFTLLAAFFMLLSLFLFYRHYQPETLQRLVLWVIQLFSNIRNHLGGSEEIYLENGRAFWVLLVLLVSLYTVTVLFKIRRPSLLLPLYVGAFIYYWYIYIDAAYPMLFLFLLLFLILKGLESYFKAAGSLDLYSPWMKTALGYGLVIMVTAGLLPKGGSLIKWHWIEAQAQAYFPMVFELRDDLVYSRSFGKSELFDFTQTGFQSNTTRLGGPVKLSDRLVMEVKAPSPLYLRGNVKNIYQNNHWSTEADYQWAHELGKLLPMEVQSGVPVTIEIRNMNMATNTIFTPYQPLKVLAGGITNATVDENFQMTFRGARYKNESYVVQALLPGGEHKEPVPSLDPSFEKYLMLPEDLPHSVYELGDEITRHVDTPYQKARAIRSYLRENYTYTLEPSVVPEDKEFVSYFLFEEKQGYCTYFATAMAVLLRTQGIPARYVEGYRMPEANEEGIYEIRQKDAHAWVEAYMGSEGWMIFEATPAYDEPVQQEAPLNREESTGNTAAEFDEMEALLERALRDSEIQPVQEPQGEVDRNLEDLPIPTLESSLTSLWVFLKRILKRFLPISLLGMLPLRILYSKLKLIYYLRSLDQGSSNQKIIYLYDHIVQMIGKIYSPIQVGETPREYAQRLQRIVYDSHYDFKEITEIYMNAKYSSKESSLLDVQRTTRYFKLIDGKLRQHLGTLKYIYVKYIKGKMIQYNKLRK